MPATTTDTQRRAYWTEQFEAAYRFMFEAILPCPVAECGEPLVPLQQAAEAADVEVQFSTTPHVRGLPRLYYLRDGQIPGFVGAAAEMNDRGWVMRVEAVQWDAATNSITPLPQPALPLNSFDEIRAEIDAALVRRG